MSKKSEIKTLLIKLGFAKNIESAKILLNCGLVYLSDKKLKTNDKILNDQVNDIRVLHSKDFVSRGAYKLESVFDKYDINLNDKVCLDVGASTGGFCDLLLQKNVKKIFAVDVGKGLLAEKIRKNPKVDVYEGVNARYLSKYFDKINNIDFCVMDLSFISIKKIVPEILPILNTDAWFVPMVKPQFECSKKDASGGVVIDMKIINGVINDIKNYLDNNFEIKGIIKSKIKGRSGNQEYFFLCKKV